VGAIFRSAAALGMDAVLISPRCADPLYRRSVKVAMGAVFSLPWTRVDDWHDAVPELEKHGFLTIALTPDPASRDLVEVIDHRTSDKVCLILGSEGPGLSARWMSSAQVKAGFAMAHGVDSLNVAAAATLAFFVVTRTDA
jgi:tRNA G18 (ribose-2'-O)-methylase SpoU